MTKLETQTIRLPRFKYSKELVGVQRGITMKSISESDTFRPECMIYGFTIYYGDAWIKNCHWGEMGYVGVICDTIHGKLKSQIIYTPKSMLFGECIYGI